MRIETTSDKITLFLEDEKFSIPAKYDKLFKKNKEKCKTTLDVLEVFLIFMKNVEQEENSLIQQKILKRKINARKMQKALN